MPESNPIFPYKLFLVQFSSIHILQFEATLDQKEAITMPAAVYVDYADTKAYVVTYPQIDNEAYRLFALFEDALQVALKFIDNQKEKLWKRQNELTQKL